MNYNVRFIIGELEGDDYHDRNLELKRDIEKSLH